MADSLRRLQSHSKSFTPLQMIQHEEGWRFRARNPVVNATVAVSEWHRIKIYLIDECPVNVPFACLLVTIVSSMIKISPSNKIYIRGRKFYITIYYLYSLTYSFLHSIIPYTI